jgi:prepilin-type N-terminal cleavage/methylation domain-containing protein
MPRQGRARGFSLIELSVVLVLLTIVLGLGLGALNAQFQSANATVTKKRQELIREALIAHLGAARRLPCADDPTTGGVTGTEDCPATFGVLPYAILGLARESAEDGWGNLFSYGVFAAPTPTCPGSGIDWKNATCFGEGKSGGFTVNDGTVAAATPLTTNAIALVIAHGPNGLGAWTREGTRNASPVGCEEAHNASFAGGGCTLLANTFFRGERQDVDDVVAYLGAGEAIQQLARQGVLKPAPARMGEDMQTAVDTVLGAFATAGCTVIPSAPTGIDPWGNAYASTVSLAGSSIYQISSGGCPTCTPAVPATGRSLTKTELNAYLLKATLPTCP